MIYGAELLDFVLGNQLKKIKKIKLNGIFKNLKVCTVDHPRRHLDAKFHEKRLSGLSLILVNSKFCP